MVTIGILPGLTIVYLLVFARVGAMVMLVPGLGERTISPRLRLAIALMLTFVFQPLVRDAYPEGLADNPTLLVGMLVMELGIGLAFGALARLLLSAAQIAGATIAYQMGLSFAQSVDPTMGEQGAVVGNFLAVTATALVFALNLHHIVIRGILDSYDLFPPGAFPPLGDLAEMAVTTVAESFRIGVQLAGPFIAFGLIFSLGLGVLSRLMPQLQVFFLASPASLLVGIALLALLIGTLMAWLTGYVESGLMRLTD